MFVIAETAEDRPWRRRHVTPATIAAGIIAAVAFCVLLLLLWEARDVFLLAFLGAIFGVTLSGPSEWLARRHVPRGIGATAIVIAVLAAIAGTAWWIAPAISAQATQVENGLPDAIDRIENALAQRSFVGLSVDVTAASAALRQYFATRSAVKMLFPVVKESLFAAAGAVMLFFLAIYLAAEAPMYREGMLRLVPPRHRDRAAALFAELGVTVRRWLVARLMAMVAIGVVTGISLWALRIPAATVLGILTGALEFIPFFGPIASATPAVAMGLLISPAKALWVIILFVVIQHIESDVVSPLIMRSRIDVPPLLTIITLTVLGIVFGMMGLLVAEPLTAVSIVITRKLYVEPIEGRPALSPHTKGEGT